MDPSLRLGRRGFCKLAAAASFSAVAPAAAAASRRTRRFSIDSFRRRSDGDWAVTIQRAVNAASHGGGGTVIGTPGQIYGLTPRRKYLSLDPSGGVAQFAVCVQIPSHVTLDMQGSTLRLLGPEEGALIANHNLRGSGPRDTSLGLVNAVLDGGDLSNQGTAMLQMAYVDNLSLRGVRIIRGQYVGGWIYNARSSVFDDLEADGFVGEPWLLGAATGVDNHIYDSAFGRLAARGVRSHPNDYYFPGNSFVFVLSRCTIDSITAIDCAAGIKIQSPTEDVRIRAVSTVRCGDAGSNSGLKLQGDTQSPVKRVTVDEVRATGQTGSGLYLEGSLDCTVGSFKGVGNSTNGAYPDVWVGGTRDRISTLISDQCGGTGVVIRPNAHGYALGEVRVTNPNVAPIPTATAAIAVFGGSGALGHVTCEETEDPADMLVGVDVNSPTAVGTIDSLSVRGAADTAFKSVSPRFVAPVPKSHR